MEKIFSFVRGIISPFVVFNITPVSPTKKNIESPKSPKSFPVFISEDQLPLILDKSNSLLMKNIFTTAFYTGMRLSELLNMKWSWIDFASNIITIKNSNEFKSKSKREGIIPIHPKVLLILKSLYPIGKPANNNLIFFKYLNIKMLS